jgi:hypothetical protein
MPRRVYRTLSIDLVEHAETAAADFERRGFRVRAEVSESGFPYTPSLICDRHPTKVIIEVISQLVQDRIETWLMYTKSLGNDTRLALCVPRSAILSADQETKLRQAGVGLYVSDGHAIEERIIPADLALHIILPPLREMSPKLRRLLGPAYEQFDRAQWREGFEEACKILEEQARRHLKSNLPRIMIVGKKGVKLLTKHEIDKMTMGALAANYENIQSQTHTDSVVGQALKKLNKDRIGVVHHKGKAVTEKRLRTNVGQHMWVIVAALKALN